MSDRRAPLAASLVVGIALAKLLVHLGTNVIVARPGGYGIFRDELYYLACAARLAAGYVDQPPLSIWLLALSRAVVGDSLFALRLLPALAGAATVFLVGLIAREMGGGRYAQGLAAGAATLSLIFVAYDVIYSMNGFDLLLAALAAWWLVKLINEGERRYWIYLGLTLGLGLLNKVGMLWIGLGIFVAVVVTAERRWLATRWPWLGGALAGLLFLPYVVWNATHDWAHLEFIRRATEGKYSGLDALDFLGGQLLIQNPFNLPIWLGGLVFLFTPAGRRYRALGVLFVTAAIVLVINGQSKPEYLASAFPGIFAAGGLAWERWLSPARRWGRALLVAVMLLGVSLLPAVLPVLPVPAYVKWAETMGIAPSTAEGKELAELPQFYADMFGWEEKAAAVAAVYHALEPQERAATAIFAENYGRAGAIEYFGPAHGIAPGITVGNHNNYWLWGPGDRTGAVVILIGGDDGPAASYESFEQAGVARCDHCMPYEKDIPIWLARGLKEPIEEVWPRIGHYD